MNDSDRQSASFKYLSHDIYGAACRICLEIDAYKPDVIIGLAHAGWMPLWLVDICGKLPERTSFRVIILLTLDRKKESILG